MNNQISYWYHLQDSFISFLAEKGYGSSSLTHYRGQIDLLIRFANAKEYDEYSSEVGQDFLNAESRLRDWKPASFRFKTTVIRRLDEYMDDEHYTFARLRIFYICPECFSEVFEGFLQSLRNDGLKEITVRQYHSLLVKMLKCFVANNVTSWSGITASLVQTAFENSSNKALFATYSRKFFSYLVANGIVVANYSGILPPVHYPRRVPSVYSYNEIEELLTKVDRGTPMGKRDYAILLLALRLGMRASDIRLLCFDNVDFKNKILNYIQFKTGVAQKLRLIPEIEEALCDYIENGRPAADIPYIFLTYRKTQLSRSVVSCVADKYFKLSGIDIKNRHHGSHSLRMTFASELVSEDVPFEVVSKLLGHEDHAAISHYVALSTESLRACALPVPEAAGRFEAFLNGEV